MERKSQVVQESAVFPVASRVAQMSASKTMAVSNLAAQLRRSGADVIDLGAGEPDFPTPENICHAATAAMENGQTKYTPAAGTIALKQAILDRFAADFGASYELNQVIGSAGAKQVIFNAVASLINPGDDVLVPKPYWVTFPEVVTFAGGRSVWVETESDNFRLTAETVERAITPRAKLLIVNSPSNPSGLVIPPDEFERIISVAVRHGLYVISDECYSQFVYDPIKPHSAAPTAGRVAQTRARRGIAFQNLRDDRLALRYALGPREWVEAMTTLQSHSTSNPTSVSQAAAIEALTGSQNSVAEMLAAYRERRDWLIPALNTLPGITCTTPDGAFYAFPSVKGALGSGDIMTSEQMATYLLEESHVAVTPGDAFGAPGYLRLSYATSLDLLQKSSRAHAHRADALFGII
ncbi:MAG: pyridoxal phosphate-dependent aminotransferase [Pyrinomonadaceae bacterium]